MATKSESHVDVLEERLHAFIKPKTERQRERRRIVGLCFPFFFLATISAFVPMATMARGSLSTDAYESIGWTFEFYRRLVTESVYLETAWNTLWFATLTTAVAVTIGVGVAHCLEKYELPFERILIALISFPIAVPGIIVAFLIIVVLGRSGLVTNALATIIGGDPIGLATATTVFGLFLAYLYSLIPRAAMVMRGTYAEINTDAEEAARSLGASPLETFYNVTLPQIRPGVVAAFILTFRTALTIFGTVLVLQSLGVATLRIHHEIANGFEMQTAASIGFLYFLFMIVFTYVGLQFTRAEVTTV